ncbi:ISNCY family transposase [Candidatus Parcubacteria bacterium]|nr:ISNCY family transposase [Candidatus Parcubacteria bacterium]
MKQELISMTEKELTRHGIIKNLIAGKINGKDASKQIQVSVRQIRRIKAKVKKKGDKGIIHGNRGRESNRKIDNKTITKTIKLLKEKYHGFRPTLATEKLLELDRIELSNEKVRQIMVENKLWKVRPRKQSKKKYFWRARKDNFGEMQQFDGSYHNWFGKEESCLLLSVDDATGKITHAKFDYNESITAVFKFWLEYFDKNGLPLSIYLDKFSTYKVNHPNATDNKDMITQFQRVSNQAGFKLIFANSPQAKGRVERMNQTLQDRLVKELRLADITTIEKANEFLEKYIPKFNAKFAVVPQKQANLHKEISVTMKQKLPQIFSIQNQRIVMNDYTIRFENQYFQLDREQPTTVYKKDAVIIENHLDGNIQINLKEHYLNYTVLPERPKKEIDIKLLALTKKQQSDWKPPMDHPWRKPFLFRKTKDLKQEIEYVK